MRRFVRRCIRVWAGQRGSNVAEAAAVALMAVVLIGALMTSSRMLGPQIGHAFSCLASALGGSGAGCTTQTAQYNSQPGTGNQGTPASATGGEQRQVTSLNLADAANGDPANNPILANTGAGPGVPEELERGDAAHRAIQAYFIANFRPTARPEVFIRGGGRNGGPGYADLVDGNEIWEIKPGSYVNNPAGREQLQRYLDHQPGSVPGQTFERFIVPFGPNKELVVQSYGQPGMLYYYERNRTTPDPVPVPVPVPAPQSQPQDNTARDVAIGGGVAVGSGAAIWWLLKILSPACGPAAPVCVVVF